MKTLEDLGYQLIFIGSGNTYRKERSSIDIDFDYKEAMKEDYDDYDDIARPSYLTLDEMKAIVALLEEKQ